MTDQRIQQDKFVLFTYQILDESGLIVEQVDLPLNYIHGRNSGMYDKIEQALEGHQAGDSLEVALPPEESFGFPKAELTYTDDIENVPEQFRYVGAQVDFRNEKGETKTFMVSKIENGKLTVDGNHPLAGRYLTFCINVLEVRDATPEELAGSVPTGRDAVGSGSSMLH